MATDVLSLTYAVRLDFVSFPLESMRLSSNNSLPSATRIRNSKPNLSAHSLQTDDPFLDPGGRPGPPLCPFWNGLPRILSAFEKLFIVYQLRGCLSSPNLPPSVRSPGRARSRDIWAGRTTYIHTTRQPPQNDTAHCHLCAYTS